MNSTSKQNSIKHESSSDAHTPLELQLQLQVEQQQNTLDALRKEVGMKL